MVSSSCDLDTAVKRFLSDKEQFKQMFNGNDMKLCGTRTWMKPIVAISRKNNLLDVFRFLYNTEATALDFDTDESTDCIDKHKTVSFSLPECLSFLSLIVRKFTFRFGFIPDTTLIQSLLRFGLERVYHIGVAKVIK